MGQTALKSRLLSAQSHPEIAFAILRAVQGHAQKVDRFWTFSTVLARIPLSEATEFNELCLCRFQNQPKLSQSLAQHVLKTKRIVPILETHHKVVDVPHQIGFTFQVWPDHPVKPQVEHIVQVQIAQQNADRPTLWGSLIVGMQFSVFEHPRLQPSSNQADDPRISDSMLHKAE